MPIDTPPSPKKYRAILFDMDGVIVDSMGYHAETWQRVFKDYGITLTKEDILKREGMSGVSSIIDIIKEKGGSIPDENEIKDLLEKKLSIFEEYRVEIFPVVPEILSFLHSKNISIGLVTGSMMRSVNLVLPGDILNQFRAIVTVDDIVNGKPHPEPYLRAMDKLECHKDNTLAIENAPFGIESAKGAGIDCFAIETTLSNKFLSKADKIFQTHESLFNYLRNII